MQQICTNMQIICTKYAPDMHLICTNMQKEYARICIGAYIAYICTPHFADVKTAEASSRLLVFTRECPTQLHHLGGPSRLRPGLTDTDSENAVLRNARRNQRCRFAGVRPDWATRPLWTFNCCRLAFDYLRDQFKNSMKLELELVLKLELCHLANRFSLRWFSTRTATLPPLQ